jgi:Zn-finger nucleic acid-binding protein
VPDSIPVAEHHIQFLPTAQSEIPCADCGTSLALAMLAGFKIAACPQCAGMLIQRRAVGPIVNRCRMAWRKPDAPVEPLNSSELGQQTACPTCDQAMETFAYSGPGCIVIDACNACDMVWLNGHELLRIVQAPGQREYRAEDLQPADGESVEIPATADESPIEMLMEFLIKQKYR